MGRDPDASMFERLFAPLNTDTSCSSDDGTGSGSASRTLSKFSTIDDSSDGSYEDTTITSYETQIFDRDLRTKHRTACKNMTVRSY